MIPSKQLNKHNPDKGVYGDCLRTCIACVLNKHPSYVPNFPNGKRSTEEVHTLLNNWLESKAGCTLVDIPYNAEQEDVQSMYAHNTKHMYYMLSGLSKNNTNHMVVCNQGKIVHDPAQDDSGIVAPCDDGYYWISLLVLL